MGQDFLWGVYMGSGGAAADQETQGVPGESKAKRRKKRNGFSAKEIEHM